MPNQSTYTIRKSISLSATLWKQIEAYQFDHRVKRDTQAIRQLIEAGLAAERMAARAGESIYEKQDREELALQDQA